MKPRYTDADRYPHGYVPARETDITVTWARAKKKLEADKKERQEKVRELRKFGAKT